MFKAVSGFNGIPSHNGAGGFEGVNDGAAPGNTIINRPFDGNLDETVNGLDVNYFDNSTDTPIFDSDGWLLQSSNDGRGIAAVSKAQVDNECFLGEFNTQIKSEYCYTSCTFCYPFHLLPIAVQSAIDGFFCCYVFPQKFETSSKRMLFKINN